MIVRWLLSSFVHYLPSNMNRLHGNAFNFVRRPLRLFQRQRAARNPAPGHSHRVSTRLYQTAAKVQPTADATLSSVCLRLALAGAGVVFLGLFGKHRKSECEQKANINSKSVSVSLAENYIPPKLTLTAAIEQARDLVQGVKVCIIISCKS